jgi:hypothetical protein
MKTVKHFSTVLLLVKVVVLLIVPMAGQLVNAQTAAPCSQAAAASILAPEWVAHRQQYERGYQPITITSIQTANTHLAALPPLAPEWVAVRQQYEPTYQPISTGCIQTTSCSPLAPEWVAVRQQYERSYTPPCQN